MKAECLSVVVVGNMNPAIHHPGWYSAWGGLSDEDSKLAYAGGNVFVVPQAAQFATSLFRIECLTNRWIITSTGPEGHAEIVSLAGRTFQRLGETPISAFGLNADYVGELVSGPSPFESLISALKLNEFKCRQLQLKQTIENLLIGKVTLERDINLYLVMQEHDSSRATLKVNAEYRVAAETTEYFDLAQLLNEAWTAFEGQASTIAAAVLIPGDQNDDAR